MLDVVRADGPGPGQPVVDRLVADPLVPLGVKGQLRAGRERPPRNGRGPRGRGQARDQPLGRALDPSESADSERATANWGSSAAKPAAETAEPAPAESVKPAAEPGLHPDRALE